MSEHKEQALDDFDEEFKYIKLFNKKPINPILILTDLVMTNKNLQSSFEHHIAEFMKQHELYDKVLNYSDDLELMHARMHYHLIENTAYKIYGAFKELRVAIIEFYEKIKNDKHLRRNNYSLACFNLFGSLPKARMIELLNIILKMFNQALYNEEFRVDKECAIECKIELIKTGGQLPDVFHFTVFRNFPSIHIDEQYVSHLDKIMDKKLMDIVKNNIYIVMPIPMTSATAPIRQIINITSAPIQQIINITY